MEVARVEGVMELFRQVAKNVANWNCWKGREDGARCRPIGDVDRNTRKQGCRICFFRAISLP